jgi:ribosomal protein S18 acetylase RimI-like enzyme
LSGLLTPKAIFGPFPFDCYSRARPPHTTVTAATVNIALRSVTQNDRRFIESLYFETQRPIIEELFGWRGDDFERQRFAETYSEANTVIVTVDDRRVGWLTINRRPDAITLEQIYVSPAWQNQGIGSFLIRQLIEEAQAAKVPLKLSTAKINRARRLYERLGFRVVGESAFKLYMERAVRFSVELDEL